MINPFFSQLKTFIGRLQIWGSFLFHSLFYTSCIAFISGVLLLVGYHKGLVETLDKALIMMIITTCFGGFTASFIALNQVLSLIEKHNLHNRF